MFPLQSKATESSPLIGQLSPHPRQPVNALPFFIAKILIWFLFLTSTLYLHFIAFLPLRLLGAEDASLCLTFFSLIDNHHYSYANTQT